MYVYAYIIICCTIIILYTSTIPFYPIKLNSHNTHYYKLQCIMKFIEFIQYNVPTTYT